MGKIFLPGMTWIGQGFESLMSEVVAIGESLTKFLKLDIEKVPDLHRQGTFKPNEYTMNYFELFNLMFQALS